METHLELPWGRMFVRRGGTGPTLVLVHGYLVSSFYFRAVRPELERHFDVVALDLPGHGESDKPSPASFDYSLAGLAGSVAQALDTLKLDRVLLWGHSMGGGTALATAALHGGRVSRLILEDPMALHQPMPFLAHVADLPLVGKPVFEKFYSRRDLASHLRGVHNDPAVCTEEDIDYFWGCFNRPGARTSMHAILHAMMRLPRESDLPARLKAPTLVVHGADDKTVPVDNGRRVGAAIGGARFEVVADCGHSPHEEKPAEMLRLAIPFLQGEATAASAAH